MIYLAVLILALIALFGEISMATAWILAGLKYKKEKFYDYLPLATVIVPCKGIEEGFKNNIKAICNLDYPKYNVVFVVDSKKDPAYPILYENCKKYKNTKVVMSRYISGSSGKISALISGIKESKNPEVYVFADSDIKPHKNWLKYLIPPLKDKNIGVTTGYRWYFPKDSQSLLLSVWNMACSISLFFFFTSFAWGGSSAIKRETFERLKIVDKWKKGFSDDLILTNAVRKSRLKIKFIAQCLIESPPEGNIHFIVKWGTRQLTWVKWYYLPSWLISVIGAVGLKIATISGFFLLFLGYTLPGVLMILTIPMEVIIGWIGHIVCKNLMLYPKKKIGSSLSYGLMMPLIFFILAYNNLSSVFKTKINWGGRTYKKTR